jgi:hypothetical protein
MRRASVHLLTSIRFPSAHNNTTATIYYYLFPSATSLATDSPSYRIHPKNLRKTLLVKTNPGHIIPTAYKVVAALSRESNIHCTTKVVDLYGHTIQSISTL